ncbi:Histone transcription regulator 3 [Exophiala dermatitidis]|nr:Histone transcription regulator 3 [Exophiala dermatitidis]KAJ4557524.1 Histone transcription regulator 3 [Exophiala dermatitidis]
MSATVLDALNVEPEDTFEEEIDDTREIQLEEAFKLYQNALRLHSQGPEYVQEALEAYKELLQSEVFKYPEVVSEFAHEELDDEVIPSSAQLDAGSLPLLPSNAAESSASSIPQLIYLAFKNRGQLLLDIAHHQLSNKEGSRSDLCQHYAKACDESLRDFAKALERDDTDLDLWKKAARVADVLSTQRIARFCLESVIAADDEDFEHSIDLSGLDEAFAAGELDEVVALIQDDLTQLRGSEMRPKSKLLARLKRTNDPYPFLPKRAKVLEYNDDRYRPLSFAVGQINLKPSSPDLFSLGRVIRDTVLGIQEGSMALSTATIVRAELQHPRLMLDDTEMTLNPDNKPGTDMPPVDNSPSESKEAPLSPTTSRSQPDSTIEVESLTLKHASEPEGGKDKETKKIEEPDGDTIEVDQPHEGVSETPIVNTRKRSATAAGNEEPEGRTKSKRIRARESLAGMAAQEDETMHEDVQAFQDQLAVLDQADQLTFESANLLLQPIGLKLFDSAADVREAFWQGDDKLSNEETSKGAHMDLQLLADLKNALLEWSDEKSHAILHGHGNQDFVENSAGMSLFLQHSKIATSKRPIVPTGSDEAALVSAVTQINAGATNIYDAAFYWLFSVLSSAQGETTACTSSYLQDAWNEDMKETVVQLALVAEPQLYETMRQRLDWLATSQTGTGAQRDLEVARHFEFAETLFEMHLDLYSAATRPNAKVDEVTRVGQRDRLMRWSSLADDFMHLYIDNSAEPTMTDPLVLRLIWASTIYATLAEEVDKTHVVLCLEDLRTVLEQTHVDPIFLPNNTSMPVISVSAIDQELSRLNTLDFFTSVFNSDNSDPVAVIEKLEPILEASARSLEDDGSNPDLLAGLTPQADQLVSFLESGDAALKLFLWRRLQNAYTAISYTPKVVSCLLRALETSVNQLYTSRHLEADAPDRQISMLKWLRDIDEILARLLAKVLDEPAAYECIDDSHLRSSLKATTALAKLLHGFVIYDDSIRIGQTPGPQLKGTASTKLYEKSKDRFKELLIRTWILQYTLVKEATVQDRASYPRAGDDLAEYLINLHHAMGMRQYCKHANKAIVKLVKSELDTLETTQDYSEDLAQVFFDLYQLRFASGFGDADHGCPPENIDRKTAWPLVPTIMKYAERHNIKDLIKSELRTTIEKVQQALGTVKSNPALAYNKRIITAYLKSTIVPEDLYRSIRGIGDLPTRPVHGDTQVAASCGWYFLLGHLTLAKFKSVKRVNPTATDDLDVAAGFLRQDLDHNIEKWQSWYRLAQVYEAKIEDDLIWNATKLNESRGEIALLERQAIHCYIMSTAMAMRLADATLETAHMIEDMLAEFGSRLYASSRPPLNMEAFRTDEQQRPLSSSVDQTMSKQPFHPPIREYSLWRFAAYLLSKKLTDRPKHWTVHYTRAKCLWKMFQSPENNGRVSAEDVLDAITESIEALPKKEKSNEPILEPHYKLVSVIYKMVKAGALTYTQAKEYMQATRYAHNVRLAEDEEGPLWVSYVLDILKKLGNADKSNWHHRITARAAHVIYDDDATAAGALGARHQFTQQIFTKTMTIQVWKPENERPGRHYVYTGRYVTFFVHLLEQLKDRANMDQLVRRIRRKTTDFLDHGKLWEEVVTTYVRLMRRIGNIPEGRERALFDGMNFEEFTKRSEKMETWARDPETSSVFLDVMRDAIDLKRLNNSLMKGPLIDDLIGDSYACLYEEFVRQLPPEEQPKPQAAVLPQGTFINMTTDLAGDSEDAERARLNDMLRAQGDGAADGPLAVSISAPVGLGLQTPSALMGIVGQAEVQRVPGKPGRTKTVTRREVQRKAEAAIVKPPPIKTPILSKRPIVEIPRRDVESPMDRRLAEARDEDQEASRPSSQGGSVHDSADGEADGEENSGSELSDLEDMGDEKKQLLSELQNARDHGGEVENEGDGGDDEENEDDDGAGGDAGEDGGEGAEKEVVEGSGEEDDGAGEDEEEGEEGEDEGEEGEDEGEEGEDEGEEGEDDEGLEEPAGHSADRQRPNVDDSIEIQDSQENADGAGAGGRESTADGEASSTV